MRSSLHVSKTATENVGCAEVAHIQWGIVRYKSTFGRNLNGSLFTMRYKILMYHIFLQIQVKKKYENCCTS